MIHTRAPRHRLFAAVAAMTACFWFRGVPQDLNLVDYGSMEGFFVNDQMVVNLRRNVVFKYDDVTVRADHARWWRSDKTVKFSDNVRVTRVAQTLTCRYLHFEGREKMLYARNNVVFADTVEMIRVTGRTARYDLERSHCILEGEPAFFRFDTAAAETLSIVGKRMMYDDSLKKTSVVDSVKVTKGLLTARCMEGYYFSADDLAQLRTDPEIFYGEHKLTGDSVDLYFSEDTLNGVSVAGNSYGLYIDPEEAETTWTRIWGDSMYMSLNDSGFLDSVWVHGNVLSKYSSAEDTIEANEVSGKTMIVDFGEKSAIRHALVWGNAECIYYVEDKSANDRNEASGDTLAAWFADGRAVRLKLLGDIRGNYFPE
ncbi:MAG: hypothetical protein GF350_11925 [Chitinivibrionales bacterium]|nr:hypothetical protein [Chitinivibrionales bacterium]